MKKITILASLLLGLSLFTACEDDRDSNPILQDPTTFVLNTPAYSTAVYDLEKSSSIELTCSQPDYGFTAVTVYSVQVSLNNDFTTEGAYYTLPTTYTTAKMNVGASEIAVAATNLALAKGKTEADFPLLTGVNIRLKAALINGKGEIFSNPVTLNNVRLHFALPPVVLPKTMNIIGNGIGGWDWSKNAIEMVPTYDNNGSFWHMIYVTAGGGLKFNIEKASNGAEFGSSATLVDNANAGLSKNDGNVAVSKAGWYLVVVKSTVVARDIKYTVEFNEPKVYLMGNTVGGWDVLDANAFTVPADGTGFFVSRALDATDEVRMCVKLADLDWWKAEFVVADGKISYRGTGGDQTRYVVNAGKRVYLNFMTGAGKYE